MDNQTPVLEWRCADAAQKLLKACMDLGLSIPEGDILDLEGRKQWHYSITVSALITTDLKPSDNREAIARMQGVALGAASVAEDLPEAERQAFAIWLIQLSRKIYEGGK